MSLARFFETSTKILVCASGAGSFLLLIANQDNNTMSQNRLLFSAGILSFALFFKLQSYKQQATLTFIMLVEGLSLITIDQLNKSDEYAGTSVEDSGFYASMLIFSGFVQWLDICWVIIFIVIHIIYVILSIIKTLLRIRGLGDGNPVFVELQETGLNEQERGQLQQMSFCYTQTANTETCSICLAILSERELVVDLPGCAHRFHVNCLNQWFDTHITCPYCRTNIRDALVQNTGA